MQVSNSMLLHLPWTIAAYVSIDRARRKNEAIAKEIFNKNRRSSAPGAAGVSSRKTGPAPSLASRIGGGITKVLCASVAVMKLTLIYYSALFRLQQSLREQPKNPLLAMWMLNGRTIFMP